MMVFWSILLVVLIPAEEAHSRQFARALCQETRALHQGARTKCVPGTKVKRDCNTCYCNERGSYMCTSKMCLTEDVLKLPKSSENNIGRAFDLPELVNAEEPCVPGKRYRLNCNTCFCSKDGRPVCTNMICFDQFSTKGTGDFYQQISEERAYDLPDIREGENCTEGQTYRLDCNVCRCSSRNNLVCTKKNCLSNSEVAKKLDFELQKREEKKAIRIEEKEANNDVPNAFDDDDDGILVEANPNSDVNIKEPYNSETEKHVKEERVKTNRKGNKIYPELDNKKCIPGEIYKKGCQRCFCTDKKIAMCTHKPCEEMVSPVRTPSDVFPSITSKEFQSLPSLPHEAARCGPGRAYSVQCNACLCLANGNLLCNTQLCVAVDEVNKLAAFKQNRKPCQLKSGQTSNDKLDPSELDAECVECWCAQGQHRCRAVEGCVPRQFLRTNHGPLEDEGHKPTAMKDVYSKCVPGMVYREKCNNCYCQPDGSLRCTRKGCLSYEQIQKLKEHRQRLLIKGN